MAQEALPNLTRDGLVVIDPQKATSILPMEESEIGQIKTFRQMFEASAARIGFEESAVGLISQLKIIVALMQTEFEGQQRTSYRKLASVF